MILPTISLPTSTLLHAWILGWTYSISCSRRPLCSIVWSEVSVSVRTPSKNPAVSVLCPLCGGLKINSEFRLTIQSFSDVLLLCSSLTNGVFHWFLAILFKKTLAKKRHIILFHVNKSGSWFLVKVKFLKNLTSRTNNLLVAILWDL